MQQVHPGQVAGVMIEPVLGEGGVRAPSQAFWDRLGAMCKKWGWLLCLDEVQTCMGRCGDMLRVRLWDGIDPDLVLMGKAFSAGGQPIAGLLGTDAVMENTELHLGSTYGFVPAAAAAALEGIRIIQDGGVLENVRELERIFLEEMTPLKDRVEQVGDARASGALAALEFVTSKATNAPAPSFQFAVYQAALRRGVYRHHSARQVALPAAAPALTMPPEVFRDSCHRIIDAVDEVAANPPARGHRARHRGRVRSLMVDPATRGGAGQVDDTDVAIITALQEDGRRPFTEIARSLELSEGTVRQRVGRLQRLGIVQDAWESSTRRGLACGVW